MTSPVAYVWNVKLDYSDPAGQPVRWLAEGRDPSANGILGAKIPNLDSKKWRWFYTQQHGDNTTWEVIPSHVDWDR